MATEDAEDEDALAIQAVECFERFSTDDQWVAYGTGTVLWQAGEEGKLQQRLLVMQKDNGGDWARQVLALDFPDPTALISCLPDEAVITWRRQGQAREFAMAFSSVDGCLQVWEDVQALQEAAMGFDGQDGVDDLLMSSLCGDGEFTPLPDPSEKALPELVLRLTGSPPAVMALLLRQIITGAAAEDRDATANGAGGRDYIGALCSLAAPLREAAAAEAAEGQGARRSSTTATRRLQLATVFKSLLAHGAEEPALLQRLLQPDALLALFSALEGDDSRHHLQTKHVNTEHVAFVADPKRFRMPVPISDARVLDKIHQNFALAYLTECALPLAIEPLTSAAIAELQASNAREILAALSKDIVFLERLFSGLCDEASYQAVSTTSPPSHGRRANGAAGLGACAAASTPGSSSDVAAVAASPFGTVEGMQVCTPASMQSLASEGVDASPPTAASGSMGRAAGAGASAAGGGRSICVPPPDEAHILQLWGLLRELTTLTAVLHPLLRVRFYKVVTQAGLLRGLGVALGAPALSEPMRHVQVRALDVLLALLAHDPSIVRVAVCTSATAEDSAAWGGSRADARRLLAGVVLLLGEGADEGALVQASEAFRILVDTSTMEAHEQNAFLDHLYGAGHIHSLLAALRSTAAILEPTATMGSGGGGGGNPRFGSLVTASVGSILGHEEADAPLSASVAVVRLEGLLDVLTSVVGQHGYRSRKALLEPALWESLKILCRGRRASLRMSAVRFVRLALTAEPCCSSAVAENGLFGILLDHLRARVSSLGMPRDTLGNSAVLALLHAVREDERLAMLRQVLASTHRADMEALAAAGIATAKQLLEVADEDIVIAAAAAGGDSAAEGGAGATRDDASSPTLSDSPPARRAPVAHPRAAAASPQDGSPDRSPARSPERRSPSRSPERSARGLEAFSAAAAAAAAASGGGTCSPPGSAGERGGGSCGASPAFSAVSVSPGRGTPGRLSPERSSDSLSMVERSLLQAQRLQAAADLHASAKGAAAAAGGGGVPANLGAEDMAPWLPASAPPSALSPSGAAFSPAVLSTGSPTRGVAPKAPSPPYTLTSPPHSSPPAHSTQPTGVENWELNKPASILGASKGGELWGVGNTEGEHGRVA